MKFFIGLMILLQDTMIFTGLWIVSLDSDFGFGMKMIMLSLAVGNLWLLVHLARTAYVEWNAQ